MDSSGGTASTVTAGLRIREGNKMSTDRENPFGPEALQKVFGGILKPVSKDPATRGRPTSSKSKRAKRKMQSASRRKNRR